MRRLFWIVVVLSAVSLIVAVATRGMGFTARGTPSSMEARMARMARTWATPADARTVVNPVAATSEVLHEGMAHWADHCATCHGNDGRGTSMGRGMYPPAPDMRAATTQPMSDGELFYVIERGIPFTGMPAWGNGEHDGEEASWKLVRFIRHLPDLTEAEIAEMETLNPKSAADIEEARRMKEFLKGK